MKPLTLVLGSGGARGLCFVGALKALETGGVPIQRVVGTSMGAIVGASFCSGVPLPELEARALRLRLRHFLGFSVFAPALMSHRGVARVVRRFVPAETFENLSVPLTVICTDLDRGEPVAFNSGPLIPPVVGSSLAAGVFEPVFHQDHVLVDGGYTDSVPVRFADHDSVVVAIDANVCPDWRIGLAKKRRLRNILKLPLFWRQIRKSFDILIYSLAMEQGAHRPHIRVAPPLGDMTFIDFGRGKTAIEIGEQAVRERLPEIRAAVGE